MVKGAELWDDSALISAFDTAMKSYKEMHVECLHGPVFDKENDDRDNKESATVLTEEAKSGRQIESEGTNLYLENNIKETCSSSCTNATATNDPFTQENGVAANCLVSEFYPPPISEDSSENTKFDVYSDNQNLNYEELLKQYNELEHRKEKIVEQLWQANYWNYQTQAQCGTSQQQVSVSIGSELGPNSSCPICACQCPIASMLSVGYTCCPQHILCCSRSQVQQEAGGSHCSINRGNCPMVNSFSVNTNHLVQRTGPMPVELMKDSSKEDLSKAFNLHEETKRREDNASSKDVSNNSQKTDLTSVINAWYWAGYHTGRYLLEQEQSDKLNRNAAGEEQLNLSKEKGGCS